MPDYSLLPVDHQPEFDHSIVPVDHDPFDDADWSRMTQPFGEMRTTDSTPSERLDNFARNSMVDMGAQPPVARPRA